MRFVRVSAAIVLCLAAIGPASAHGGFSAPARIQVSHGPSFRARTSFKATIGINATLVGGGLYNGGEGVSEITVFAVPSAAQRYMNATGRALPAAHSNILLPPATVTGDYTYIWANNGPE